MVQPRLTSLNLTAFKSLRDQSLTFDAVTLLVGRNGSGKSNVLDALSLLALLADDRDVNDLERGDQEVAGLRGGLSGASPFGVPKIELGCSITTSTGGELSLELVLDSQERPEIISESLVLKEKNKSTKVLIDGKRKAKGAGISEVQVYSGGAPRGYQLLSTRLATVQARTKIPADTKARQLVVECCEQVTATLQGIFILDPVPAQMREYVRIGSLPDRTGSSVSALIHRLRDDESAWARLNELVRGLVESEVLEVTFSEGRIPGDDHLVDVMVALREAAPSGDFVVPARMMSDGTLRYLAIVASLLGLEPNDTVAGTEVRRSLVVEEIENGLFPSQAETVLDLLRTEATARGTTLIATTHSPALLDAIRPEDHAGIVICSRDPVTHLSKLQSLVDHPRYVELAGSGRFGQAVTAGKLQPVVTKPASFAELFAS